MTKISQSILSKLQEMEENPKVPFMWTEKLLCSIYKTKYTRTHFVHFDKALYVWELNFFGGRRFAKNKVELEISQEFSSWIKKFKITTKEKLTKRLLEEDDDVLRAKCKRDEKDFEQTRESIEKELGFCFKNLK